MECATFMKAVFFVVSQVAAVCVFRKPISPPMLVGGALIVTGGLVLSCWPNATSSP
jgi:hypothetical protein